MGSYDDQVGLPPRRMVDDYSLRFSLLHHLTGSKARLAEFLSSAPHEFLSFLLTVFFYRSDVRDIVRDHRGGNVIGNRFNDVQHAHLSSIRPHLFNNTPNCRL